MRNKTQNNEEDEDEGEEEFEVKIKPIKNLTSKTLNSKRISRK